jgi:hypothetical protein
MAVNNRTHRFYNSTTLSSARVRHKSWAHHKAQSVSLGPKGIQSRKVAAAQESRTQVFYPEHVPNPPIVNDVDGASDDDWEMADSVLAGRTEASISHAGGELDSLLEEWVRDNERRRYERFRHRLFNADVDAR